MSEAIKEKRPKDFKKPVSINTFRLAFNEKDIVLEFGDICDEKEQEIVKIVASMKFDPNILQPLVLDLYMAGIDYQAKFGNDIGFPDPETLTDKKEKEQL